VFRDETDAHPGNHCLLDRFIAAHLHAGLIGKARLREDPLHRGAGARALFADQESFAGQLPHLHAALGGQRM
jgi:hypothetical protein